MLARNVLRDERERFQIGTKAQKMNACGNVLKVILLGAASLFAGSALGVPITSNGPGTLVPEAYNLAFPEIYKFENAITQDPSAVIHAIQMVQGQSVYSYLDEDGYLQTVTITRPDGTPLPPDGMYPHPSVHQLTGPAWSMTSWESAADPVPGFYSGTTLTFSSPVNAFGFELAHWATTGNEVGAPPRPLWIQEMYGAPYRGNGIWFAYDDHAPFIAINSMSWLDNPGNLWGPRNEFNFVGAVDPSLTFTSVTIFSDGFGDSIYAGGTLRFATVPEPSSFALLAIAIAAASVARRRNIKA